MGERNRIQRYRVTWEFTLKDRSQYARVCKWLRAALAPIDCAFDIQPDYLAIEKVEDK